MRNVRKKILSLLETSFGKKNIKSKPENRREREFDKPYRLEKGNPKIHTKVLPFDVKTPTLAISFRAPEFKHADIPSLDILTGVLALGESSRLYQELFNKESMVHDVSGGLYVVRDPGMIYFSLESQTLEQLKQASYVFAKVLDRLDFRSQYYQTVTQEEMDRVIQTTESEKIYAAQSVDGIAGRLGTLGFVIGNMNYDRDYLGQLKSLDHEKLEKCFLEYFQASRCSLVVMCPEEQKDEAQSVLNSIREVFEKQLDFGKKHEERSLKKVTTAQQRKKQTTAYDSILLSNGHRVLHRRRVGTQHFSLYTIGMGGSRLETSELSGISHMMAMTLSKGTHSRTSQQIASLVEGKAAALDGFSGRHTNGIQCVGLKRDVSELLDLFSDVLKNPSFDPTEVDHSKRVILESIRSIEENSAQLCSRYFVENLYDEHPYRRLSMGTEENVKKFNTSDLARAHREWLSRPGVVFSLVGDYSDRDLQNLLKQLEMIPTQAQSSIQKLESSLQQPQALKAPRWVERLMDREQVHLIKGSLGLTMKSDDRWAMRLLQDILGGQSGRLFIELREKKSLCYSVAPLSFEGMEAGYVGTYIACSHEKADESLKGIDQVLRACAEQGPSVSELKRAMEYYLGQRAMELQGNSSLATHYGLQKVYDLNPMSESEVAQRVRSVTAKQIQEVCRKYYLEPYSVIAKVG
jgi:zinc protease